MPELDESVVPIHVVLVCDDDEGSWWIKAQIPAATADEALDAAWADTYLSPRRNGSTEQRYRCAVVSPGEGWREFSVVVRAQRATVSIGAPRGAA